MNPNYRYPLPLLCQVAGGLITGRSRSFRKDSRSIFSFQPDILDIRGVEFIPQKGPCVITFNHYHRSGFDAWWLALAISATIPIDIHWIVTSQVNQIDRWYGFLWKSASRWALRKGSKLYGFTRMPPMPPVPEDAEERAAAVRQVLTYARNHPSPCIGLAPEGMDVPGGVLSIPAPGLGRFCLLLSAMGIPFTPIGIHESEGRLKLNFGKQYALQVPDGLSTRQKDQMAAQMIMKHIADLLPEHLRGEYK